MPKPIIVIYYLPDAMTSAGGKLIPYHEVLDAFETKFPDYHVLCLPSYLSVDGSLENIRLQVFYDKDFTDIDYTSLKLLINESLN